MAKRRVVITGAAGYIATRMLPTLRERYELTLLDITNKTRDGQVIEDIILCDLLDRNRDSYRHHFEGKDTVLHCAYIKPKDPSEAFWRELENIVMAYNIYQTCVEVGVRRVVMCSSNHAADFYERLLWAGKWDKMVTPEMVPLSDNFYGWSKAAYELLGFVFAVGKVNGGKQLEVIQIRIGAPYDPDFERYPLDDLHHLRRALGAYLSPEDQAQLFIKAIETEDIRDENGVPFLIVYGISGNTGRFWSLQSARKVLGYMPQSDAFVRFAERLLPLLKGAKEKTP